MNRLVRRSPPGTPRLCRSRAGRSARRRADALLGLHHHPPRCPSRRARADPRRHRPVPRVAARRAGHPAHPSARPEHGAARDLQREHRPLEQDVAARHARDAPARDEGLRVRPDERRRRRAPRPARSARSSAAPAPPTRSRPRSRTTSAAAQQGITRRPRVLVILGVGRTPVRDARQLVGRRHRGQGRRPAADERADVRRAASRGSPTRSWSSATRTSSSPSRTAAPATSRGSPRTTAPTRTGATRGAVKNNRVYVATGNRCCSRIPGVAATIRDVRAKFLKNY